jgi:molecular chaperone HtpG
VFITDQATQFLPLYLRFVRGVVDSSELSLNVSRELLQQDEAIGAMRSALTKRVLDMLERLADEHPDKYATFWREFGTLIKEGLVEDAANRDRLARLLRFNTTRSSDHSADRSLKQYLEDAKPEQKNIYFLIGESPTAARSSPHLETFRERGVEVLLLSDRLDEWVMQHLTEHGGKPLKDVRRGALDPGELGAEPAKQEPDNEQKQVLKRVKRVLRERVDEVAARVGRLTRAQRARPRLSDARAAPGRGPRAAALDPESRAEPGARARSPARARERRGPVRAPVAPSIRASRFGRGPPARGSGCVRQALERAPDGA